MFAKEKYLPFILFEKNKLSDGLKNDQEKDENLFRQVSYTDMLSLIHPYKATYSISYQSAGTIHLECFLDSNNEWKKLQVRRLILAPIKRRTGYKPQLFRIYRVQRKRTSRGAVVAVDACHVMYDLNYTLVGQVNYKGDIRSFFAAINLYSWWEFGNHIPGYIPQNSFLFEKFYYASDGTEQGTNNNTFRDLSLSNFRFKNEADGNSNIDSFSNGGFTSFSELLISGETSFVSTPKKTAGGVKFDMLLDADNFLINFKKMPSSSEVKFMVRYGRDSSDLSKTIDSTDTYSYLYRITNVEIPDTPAAGIGLHTYGSFGMPFAQEAKMMFSYNQDTENVSEVFVNDSQEQFIEHQFPSTAYDVKLNENAADDILGMAEYDIGDYGIIFDEELGINDTQCIISKEIDLITNRVTAIKLGQFPASITRKPSTNLQTSGNSAAEKQIAYLQTDLAAINASIEGVL